MSDYVLFSNIGTTDPIRNDYDGPFLHIIRKYKPKKAYIFLTKEMCEVDEKYNAYERAAKVIDPDIEIIKEKFEEIDEPNNFLIFDEKYEKILNDILKDNPNCEILINISSGTPQMICSLYNLTANSDKPLKLIQVITPTKKGAKADHVVDFSNVEDLVLNSYDTVCSEADGIENRCSEKKPLNIRKQTIERIIQEHIKIYDYEGAYQASKEAEDLIDKEVIKLLAFLKDRSKLEFDNIDKSLLPIQTTGVRDIYEYILYLQNKLKKNEILEFSRGISPVLTHLFEAYLKEVYKVDIKDYCFKENGVYKLEKYNMPRDVQRMYDDTFNGEYRTSDLCGKNIEPYLVYCAKYKQNKKLSEVLDQLKKFETNFRNKAAHQIVSISNEDIKKYMKSKDFGKDIGAYQILKNLKYLFEGAFNRNYKDKIDWDSYDNMNKKILEKLKKDRGDESVRLSEACN